MRQMIIIRGNDPYDLMDQYNKLSVELGKKLIKEEGIDATSMRIYIVTSAVEEINEPIKKSGTCSTCPHFSSARSSGGRSSKVCWGECSLLNNAKVHEHKQWCSLYRRDIEWQVVECQEERRQNVSKRQA